ncbi:Sec-independent protein translocase subunit TatA [Brevibacterium daeguense]|uniref:Sec-independent protein translocase protein TatA n=1 Tax=Brevibacterium daeguense TaxID=909936 RepID=A0ABP8ENG5_9MICO|nr:Sec-independent protein translocase subunit TatA [Brevibacterium daeguense]
MRPEPIHIIILIIVILLVFGAPKLPMIAKNLGKSMKIFKSEVKDLRNDDSNTTASHEITDASQSTAQAPTAQAPSEAPHAEAPVRDQTDEKHRQQ